MKARYAVLVAIAGAVAVTSVGAAAPEASKQRVTITGRGLFNSTSFGTFVLTPLRAGALESDSGTGTATWTSREVMRDGAKVGISIWVTTLEGKRGTLVIRERMEGVGAETGITPPSAPGRSCAGRASMPRRPEAESLATWSSSGLGPGTTAEKVSSPFRKARARDGAASARAPLRPAVTGLKRT